MSYLNVQCRTYFRKIKHPGIVHFIKKCPFWKNVFLNLNQKCRKQIRIKRYLIFTCPSWLPKGPFVKQSSLFIEVKNLFIRIFSLNSFILNIFFFSLFFFWNVITYFIRLFYNTRGIMAFMLKIWTLIVDNRLNRYAHHPLRKYFLWNTWLWIKTFYFSRLLWIILARFSKKTYLC